MGLKDISDRLKERNRTLWELIAFWLLGSIATVVDLGVFALGNYVLFTPYREVGVSWWLLRYPPENGGLCALLAFAVSFALSQTVNFFVQRKATFSATNNAAASAVMYAVMVLGVYAFVLWLPTLLTAPIYLALGAGLGGVAVKLICQFASFLIQFPINKWVIMRRKPRGKDENRA